LKDFKLPYQILLLQPTNSSTSSAADQQFYFVANSLAKLLETATRELERDREAAKASLVTASCVLQSEIERCSGANDSRTGGLAGWQIARVRAYIDSNLHRTIHIRDLSTVARRSPAHFSRKFKLAVGESSPAYVVRRRLKKACHLMITSSVSLSEIALSAGFSNQAHLGRLFRQAFGQSPARWQRERGIPGEVTLRTSTDEKIPSATDLAELTLQRRRMSEADRLVSEALDRSRNRRKSLRALGLQLGTCCGRNGHSRV
jgi:AraC family transcriptional regulator